jgi:hypothetical protein
LPAVDVATSRAHSIKRSTTGLGVRFFNVKTVTGHDHGGSSTGNGFSPYRLSSLRIADMGATVMKRPPATIFARRSSELVTRWAVGMACPCDLKAAATSS